MTTSRANETTANLTAKPWRVTYQPTEQTAFNRPAVVSLHDTYVDAAQAAEHYRTGARAYAKAHPSAPVQGTFIVAANSDTEHGTDR